MELPIEVSKLVGKELYSRAIKVRYKNWQGNVAERNIIPLSIFYGSTEFHKEEQWLLKVWDLDKSDYRTYALRDIQEWLWQ